MKIIRLGKNIKLHEMAYKDKDNLLAIFKRFVEDRNYLETDEDRKAFYSAARDFLAKIAHLL
jgi:hypothetical protein